MIHGKNKIFEKKKHYNFAGHISVNLGQSWLTKCDRIGKSIQRLDESTFRFSVVFGILDYFDSLPKAIYNFHSAKFCKNFTNNSCVWINYGICVFFLKNILSSFTWIACEIRSKHARNNGWYWFVLELKTSKNFRKSEKIAQMKCARKFLKIVQFWLKSSARNQEKSIPWRILLLLMPNLTSCETSVWELADSLSSTLK